jgi:hypothetical protein
MRPSGQALGQEIGKKAPGAPLGQQDRPVPSPAAPRASNLLPAGLLAALDSAGNKHMMSSKAPSPSGAFGPIGSRPSGSNGSATSSAPSTPGPGAAAAGPNQASHFQQPAAAPLPPKKPQAAQPLAAPWAQAHEPASNHASAGGLPATKQPPVNSLATGMGGLSLDIRHNAQSVSGQPEAESGSAWAAAAERRGQQQPTADRSFKGLVAFLVSSAPLSRRLSQFAHM